MCLYHATTRVLRIGDTVNADHPTTFYPDVLKVLEHARTLGKPSRSICVFAAETRVAATSYLKAQLPGGVDPIKVYVVAMPMFHRAPFRVIAELKKRLKANAPFNALVAEYWNPQLPWLFWEYFGPSITVVKESSPTTAAEVTRFNLQYDSDLDLGTSV